MKKRLFSIFLGICCFVSSFSMYSVYADDGIYSIYVSSENGDDSKGNGSIDNPYQTVKRAQIRMRQIMPTYTGKEIRVILREGEYPPITLNSDISGNSRFSVKYMGYKDEKAVVTNSTVLSAKDFKEVTDLSVLSRIPSSARDKVRVLDLSEYGITSVPKLQPIKNAQETPIGAGLFIDDTYMTTARWPDSGYVKLNEFAQNISTSENSATSEYTHTLSYNPEYYDFSRWQNADDAYFCGFFNYVYFFKYMTVDALNVNSNTFTVTQTESSILRDNAKMFVNNLIEELSSPGEWYLSPDDLKLYIYPPYDITNSVIRFVHKEQSTIYTPSGSVTNYTSIENLTIDGSYNCAVLFDNNGTHNTVKNCVIKNGCEDAVTMNGSYCTISSNHVYNMGIGGVRTICFQNPGINEAYSDTHNLITNNNIHDYALIQRAYASAVYTYGVGGEISHNEIYNAPHNAISVAGILTDIEYNDIHNVLTDTGDAGAIYIGGRWNTRGHNIRYNKIYDSYSNPEGGTVGIYFDDCASANNVYGNIIDSMTGIGVYIHGGRDNVIDNNIISNCYGNNNGTFESGIWVAPVANYSAAMSGMMAQNPNFGNSTMFASYFERWENWEKLFNGEPYNRPFENQVINNTLVGYTNQNALCYGAKNVNTPPVDWNLITENNIVYENASDFYKNASRSDFRHSILNGTDSKFSYSMYQADNYFKEWFLDDLSVNYDATIEMTVENHPEYDTTLRGEYYGPRFTINNRYCPVTFSVEKDGIYYLDENNLWVKGNTSLEILENVKYTYQLKVREKNCSLYINNQKQFDFKINEPESGVVNYDNFYVEYHLPEGVKSSFRLHNFKVENVYKNEVIIDCFDGEISNRVISNLTAETQPNKRYGAQKLLSVTGEENGDSGTVTYIIPTTCYITDFSVIHTQNANNNGSIGVTLSSTSNSKKEYAGPDLIDRTYIFGYDGFRYLISPNDSWKKGNMAVNKYNRLLVNIARTVDKSEADYPELIRVIIEYKNKNTVFDTENPQTVFDKQFVFNNLSEASLLLKSDTVIHNSSPYISVEADGIRFSNSADIKKLIKIPVIKIGQKASEGMNMIINTGYSFDNIPGAECLVTEDDNYYVAEFITDSSDVFTAIGAVYDESGKLLSVNTELIDYDKWLVIEKNGGQRLKIITVNNLGELKPLDYSLSKY